MAEFPSDPALLQGVLDTLPDPVFVKDREHRWIACNTSFCRLMGRPRDAVIGHSDPDFFPPAEVAVFWRQDDLVFTTGESDENEEQLTDASGVERTIWTRKFPLRGDDGAIIGLCGIISDVTALHARVTRAERLEAEHREQAARLAAQEALLATISLPVVEVWRQVLLIPIVGELRRDRAARLRDDVLREISRVQARFAVFDLTGAPVFDSNAAAALLLTTRAAALLGCKSVVCGISAAAAQAIVGLGLDLGALHPCGNLRDGLALVMRLLEGSPRGG